MDIDILRTFVEVSRTRHFGKAAENLFVTQSAVSARIRLLERTLGAELFHRGRNNIQLTPAGRRLIPYAETMVNLWNRVRQQVAARDDVDLTLSVAGVSSLWDVFLQSWLERLYRGQHPIIVTAEVQAADTQIRMLREASLDLGFMFETPLASGLEVREVARIPLIMVSSRPDDDIQHALGDNYILVDWGTAFAADHARRFADVLPPRCRVGLGRIAHSLLLNVGGAAYLAEPTVRRDLAVGRLYEVAAAPTIERTAYAVYAADGDRREAVEFALQRVATVDQPHHGPQGQIHG